MIFQLLQTHAQSNPETYNRNELSKDERTRFYITPKRIVWQSYSRVKYVKNPEAVLEKGVGQAIVCNKQGLALKSDKNLQSAILLDFGQQLTRGIQIVTNTRTNVSRLQIRFGESAGEALSQHICCY